MSVSPQSLARTRDKRSHKVPARFNDNVYAIVEASDSVRTSTRTRPGSLASKREHEDDGCEKEETIKAMRAHHSSSKKSKTGSHNESVTTTSRPLTEHVDRNSPSTPPPSKTPSPTIPPMATTSTTPATTKPTPTTTRPTPIASKPTIATPKPATSTPKPVTTTTKPPTSTTKPTTSATKPASTSTKPITTTTAVTTTTTTNIITTQPKTPATQKPTTSNVGSSGSSSSNNINSNPSKKEISPATDNSIKKNSSKGQSLIAKQQAAATTNLTSKRIDADKSATPRQGPTATIAGGLSNFNIHQSNQLIQPPANAVTPILVANGTVQPAPSMPAPPTASAPLPTLGPTPTVPRYFNNLTTNPQYGSRLMINEPIYLPRSVAPIAPITATLHQIALQARKQPFISKKAEACLAYQDELRLNHMLSNHAALVKIVSYLGVRDRINMRCVNKTWKSVVDSESVWKRVIFEKNDKNVLFKPLVDRYLGKFRTTEVVIKEFEPSESDNEQSLLAQDQEFGVALRQNVPSIRHITIRSLNMHQNSLAIRILQNMRSHFLCESWINDKKMPQCKWQVKIAVDPAGIATVALPSWEVLGIPGKQVAPRGECCVELYDLIERFDADKYNAQNKVVDIEVEPI